MMKSQYYIEDNKPSSNSAKDLFVYCVEKVIASDLFSQAYMQYSHGHLGCATGASPRAHIPQGRAIVPAVFQEQGR